MFFNEKIKEYLLNNTDFELKKKCDETYSTDNEPDDDFTRIFHGTKLRTNFLFVNKEHGYIAKLYWKYESQDVYNITFVGSLKDEKPITELYDYINKNFSVDKSKKFLFYIRVEHGQKIKLDPIDLKTNLTEENLYLNYGKEFSEHHHLKIKDKLSELNSGIYMLYGKPGTGKTSYIKYLSTVLKRKVVVVPPSLVEEFNKPHFINGLNTLKNCILAIEDAELILEKRANDARNELVTSVLNIADGLSSQYFNISLILTFNTKKENIDSALLRKGRLRYSYEFGDLSTEDSQTLCDHLYGTGKHEVFDSMPLCDIYHLEDDNNEEYDSKKMGFGR
jgi:hypothetical protein